MHHHPTQDTTGSAAQAHSHPGHAHGPVDTHSRAFVIAIGLNMVFVTVEFIYGILAHSTALIADAGHNLSDVLGLALAWGAALLGRKAPSRHFTYGLRSSSILAAMANAVLLLVACGAIAWEAIERLMAPTDVTGLTVSVVAAVGLVVNAISALLFAKGRQGDLNIRGAFLHMAADAGVSLGVVVAGIVIYFTDWFWIDPALSLVIVAVVLAGTWSLLRHSVELALNAVPQNVDRPAIEDYLRERPGVAEIHDLHIWGMSTTENALTVHLVIPEGHPGDPFINDTMATLKDRYAIHHSTLQIERSTTHPHCSLV